MRRARDKITSLCQIITCRKATTFTSEWDTSGASISSMASGSVTISPLLFQSVPPQLCRAAVILVRIYLQYFCQWLRSFSHKHSAIVRWKCCKTSFVCFLGTSVSALDQGLTLRTSVVLFPFPIRYRYSGLKTHRYHGVWVKPLQLCYDTTSF